jgi:hypothetical protein
MTNSTSASDVTEAPVERRDRFGFVVAAVAIVLGLLAFIADLVEGIAGHVLIALTSSGFAWGLAAFLVGRAASTRRRAVIGGAGLLVVATLLYFLLVLLVSRRWSGAYVQDPATGMNTPADLYGLRSVAITTALWLGGSATAGPLLALLGQAVRSSAATHAALAAGVACGLLSGEGWYSVWSAPLWRLDLNGPYGADFARGVALSQAVRVVLPLAVLIWLAVAHGLGRAWATLVVTTVVSAAAGGLIWSGVEHARYLV